MNALFGFGIVMDGVRAICTRSYELRKFRHPLKGVTECESLPHFEPTKLPRKTSHPRARARI